MVMGHCADCKNQGLCGTDQAIDNLLRKAIGRTHELGCQNGLSEQIREIVGENCNQFVDGSIE